jgi:hypothetical protein
MISSITVESVFKTVNRYKNITKIIPKPKLTKDQNKEKRKKNPTD